MFGITVWEDGTVRDVFDTEIYVDEGVSLIEITRDQKDMMYSSGGHHLWEYVNGTLHKKQIPEDASDYIAQVVP